MPAFSKRMSRWIEIVEARAWWILGIYAVLFAGALYFSISSLGINTDLSDMISDKLEFHHRWKTYKKEFPHLNDTLLVVIDSPFPQSSRDAADWLAEQVRSEPEHFQQVFRLNGGEFLETYGPLMQEETKLEALEQYQRLSFGLSQSPDLPRLVAILSQIPTTENETGFWQELERSLRQESEVQILADPSEEDRQFVEIYPQLNFERLLPAESAVIRIRELFDSYSDESVRFRLTGSAALGYEELQSVSAGASLAGLLSLILVAFILFATFRSSKLIFVSLSTLVIGLVLTAGFAALSIGHLNLISVAFAVLFIGLGIDYSIHLCLRYRELSQEGRSHQQALRQSFNDIGGSLLLCCLTTAAGFFSFVPTAYAGVSELGLIAGAGMIINLAIHLSFFPAVLYLVRPLFTQDLDIKSSPGSKLSKLAYRHYRWVRFVALALAIVSLPFAIKVSFDPNPLNLQDPNTEAFKTYQSLLKETNRSPWTIKILERDRDEAASLVERLEALPEVSQVVWLESFIPDRQDQKLAYLAKLRWPQAYKTRESSPAETWKILERWIEGLRQSPFTATKQSILAALENFQTKYENSRAEAVRVLEKVWLNPIARDLQNLPHLLPTRAVNLNNMASEVKDRYLSEAGMYRLEVFPRDNINDIRRMREFALAVQSISSQATDDPVTLPLSGDAVVKAFIQASLLAFVLIFILGWVAMKSFSATLFIMLPIFFSALVLKAWMSLFGMDFNFANIIVLPLLLGIGVDSGVHLLHRLRSGLPEEVLRGSTSRAVYYSALTTIASFGTLAISSHRGTASMGFLLMIGTLVVMLSTLTLIPALIRRR